MTGLLICAAVAAGLVIYYHLGLAIMLLQLPEGRRHLRLGSAILGLALIAVALWLDYAAGAQP